MQALLPVGGQQFINTLEYASLLPDHGMVRKFGLSYLKEHGFLLTKKAAHRLH